MFFFISEYEKKKNGNSLVNRAHKKETLDERKEISLDDENNNNNCSYSCSCFSPLSLICMYRNKTLFSSENFFYV